jgi:hypothetical protein
VASRPAFRGGNHFTLFEPKTQPTNLARKRSENLFLEFGDPTGQAFVFRRYWSSSLSHSERALVSDRLSAENARVLSPHRPFWLGLEKEEIVSSFIIICNPKVVVFWQSVKAPKPGKRFLKFPPLGGEISPLAPPPHPRSCVRMSAKISNRFKSSHWKSLYSNIKFFPSGQKSFARAFLHAFSHTATRQ